MNKEGIRDIIKDYTHGLSAYEVNKILFEKEVDVEKIMNLYDTDLKNGVKDPMRSIMLHGSNKIFIENKETKQSLFALTLYEKLLIVACILQGIGWIMIDYNIKYIIEYFGVIVFLFIIKYLSLYYDKKAEECALQTEKNKPKIEYIVLRDKKKVKIDESDIVAGDIIYLKSGIRIPVDGFLVSGNSLIVNEIAMSGENQKIIKRPLQRSNKETLSPVLVSQTHVINGCGWMISICVGEKSSGYARQCVDKHLNFREDNDGSISRTKIEFLYAGFCKVFRNVSIIIFLTVAILIGVYTFYIGFEHSLILQICRYLTQGGILAFFGHQFLVEKAYEKFFKFSCFDLSNLGIYISKLECFEEIPKIKTMIFNRSGILSTNEYILQKLWLGNEIAEFEQNFEELEITKPLQADETTVEILTQALLGNIDEVMPNNIDRSFVRFLMSIVGLTEEELPEQIASNYHPSNYRVFPNSDNKRMMTLVDRPNGDKRLLIKGSFDELYRQCTIYVDDEGNQKKIDNDTRDKIRNQIADAQTECLIPICICYKDITLEDLKPRTQNSDSGGPSSEDFEEFLNDQADLTLIAVALFKNPVNIWIPSCISKIQKARVKSLLVSSSSTGHYYANECGIMWEGNENEEIDAKEFYEKAQNNRFWLEHHVHHIKVLTKASAIHKYYLLDCLLNINEETMVITNKADDLSTIKRTNISVCSSEIDNSNLIEYSSIVLSKRGFLEVYNLFKYARYMEQCIKECYIYCISSIYSITILSLLFAIFRGDVLFEPIHLLILLFVEILVGEFLFKTIIGSDENIEEYDSSDESLKGYSLDEKSKRILRHHINYSIVIPAIVFIFNLVPTDYGYYFNSEGLIGRVDNGIPQINNFIIVFILISRVCSALNLRCKSLNLWLKAVKMPQFIIMIISVICIITLSFTTEFFSNLFQIKPMEIVEFSVCLLLGISTLLIQMFTTGLRAIQNSEGLKNPSHQSMREMARLDFTADFD